MGGWAVPSEHRVLLLWRCCCLRHRLRPGEKHLFILFRGLWGLNLIIWLFAKLVQASLAEEGSGDLMPLGRGLFALLIQTILGIDFFVNLHQSKDFKGSKRNLRSAQGGKSTKCHMVQHNFFDHVLTKQWISRRWRTYGIGVTKGLCFVH